MAIITHHIELSKDQLEGLRAGDDVMIPSTSTDGTEGNIHVMYKGDEEPMAQPEEEYGTEETYGEEGKVESGDIGTFTQNESKLLKFKEFIKL